MTSRRALHFVFKVGDRTATSSFFKDILEMKFLRHEEFKEGCKASCNGPYDGQWSKSMVGYGPEDNHFVVELTYNYGIGHYQLGNDFQGITISSSTAVNNVKTKQWPVVKNDGDQKCDVIVESPDGYRFFLIDENVSEDPVQKVTLSVSNLERSVGYWRDLCGMKVFSEQEGRALLGFAADQCKLELVDIGRPVEHATAFGRIAFSCPRDQLPGIQDTMDKAGQKILTRLLSLDTPGKATVEVVILADPDGHEICFVGDEAFRQLSAVDPQADTLLSQGIAGDKSAEWFAKRGGKASAQ